MVWLLAMVFQPLVSAKQDLQCSVDRSEETTVVGETSVVKKLSARMELSAAAVAAVAAAAAAAAVVV